MKNLTIVTVCYNDLESLQKTIASLREQTTHDFEHWIIDGASKDGTREFLSSLHVPWDLKFISEPDRGLYDAMNKGLDRASGHFVWFLNAGDICASLEVVALALAEISRNAKADLIYGKVLFASEFGLRPVGTKVTGADFRSGMPISHQAIFYRTSVLRKRRYSSDYRLISDWVATKWFFENERTCVYVDHVFTVYNLEGVSSKNHWKVIREQLRHAKGLGERWHILSRKGVRYGLIAFGKKTGLFQIYKRWQHR